MHNAQTFDELIYTEPDGPFASWLKATSEKRDFEEWLTKSFSGFHASKIRNRPVTVLDLGCSWGSTSFRIIKALQNYGLNVAYTGVDPYNAQLVKFRRLADKEGLRGVRLVMGKVESYVPDHVYDLVIANHVLYYVPDMQASLKNMLSAGREVIVVHHGVRGVNTVQQAYKEHVKPGPHVISTDNDVARCLDRLDLNDRRIEHHKLTTTVDIAACVDPDSKYGKNIISFFLEREVKSVGNNVATEIRRFLRETYAPTYMMTHDVGVFTITSTPLSPA